MAVVVGFGQVRSAEDVSMGALSRNRGGRVKGTAQLEVAITGLTLSDGRRIRLDTALAASAAKSEKKKDVGRVAITTGAGALIGGIAGGGQGAAIGAPAGDADVGVIEIGRPGHGVHPDVWRHLADPSNSRWRRMRAR